MVHFILFILYSNGQMIHSLIQATAEMWVAEFFLCLLLRMSGRENERLYGYVTARCYFFTCTVQRNVHVHRPTHTSVLTHWHTTPIHHHHSTHGFLLWMWCCLCQLCAVCRSLLPCIFLLIFYFHCWFCCLCKFSSRFLQVKVQVQFLNFNFDFWLSGVIPEVPQFQFHILQYEDCR